MQTWAGQRAVAGRGLVAWPKSADALPCARVGGNGNCQVPRRGRWLVTRWCSRARAKPQRCDHSHGIARSCLHAMIPRTSSRSRSSFSRHSRRTPIAVVGDGAEGDAEPTADSSSRSSEAISSLGEASSSKHTVWGGMAAHMDHPESMQGWLHKKHTHKKRLTHQWGKRYFVLDAEKMILRYHKSESSKKPRAVFHLSTVSLELVDDGTPHAFNIVTSDLTLTVHAESRAVRRTLDVHYLC
eukprot:6214132-Pleurochrysis_carterae.AAC.2